MSRRSSLLAFVLASATAAATAATCFADHAPKGKHHPLKVSDIEEVVEDFDETVDGKPATDVVILSEGYNATSRAAFLAKAKQCAVSLRTTSAAEPMREVTTFNFYY